MMAREYPQQAQAKRQNGEQDSQDQENGADDAANPACVGHGPTTWIHCASVHLFQIAIAHDPGDDAQRGAEHKAQNTENKDESSVVWFHKSGSLSAVK